MTKDKIEQKLDKILETMNIRFKKTDKRLDKFQEILDLKADKLDLNRIWAKQVEMDEKLNILVDAVDSHGDRISRHENILSIHANSIENLDVRLKVLESKD